MATKKVKYYKLTLPWLAITNSQYFNSKIKTFFDLVVVNLSNLYYIFPPFRKKKSRTRVFAFRVPQFWEKVLFFLS